MRQHPTSLRPRLTAYAGVLVALSLLCCHAAKGQRMSTLADHYLESLRLNVLDALRYHYRDRPEFYPNNIVTEAEYTAAERLCTGELGVTYDMPAPPFMTYRAFPIPVR